jgi:hypothetical protein
VKVDGVASQGTWQADVRRKYQMAMSKATIKRMISSGKYAGYNADVKGEFKRLAMRFLNEVAILLDATKSDIRYNAGGIAVSGEATLHTNSVYVQISSIEYGVLVRTVRGRKDYTGGHNTWYSYDRLVELGAQGLAAYAAQLIARDAAKTSVSDLWRKMCEFDGVDPNDQFVVFSDSNPFRAAYNEAIAKLQRSISQTSGE